MKILKIELSGYQRLMLNNINYLCLTPESKIQMILGTNGSGKSSLVKELSPLPAIHTEFIKGGYKYIEIEHANSLYQLRNDFGATNSYSFIKDGVELNQSENITVYKDLVAAEFNITTEVHGVMCGTTNFHEMSVSERRAWFTKVSDSDYTYAVKYFNRLKEHHRDIAGAIKLSKSRLLIESNKLLDTNEESSLRDELKKSELLLDFLLNSKTTISLSKDSILSELNKTDSKLQSIVGEVNKRGKILPESENFRSIAEINSVIQDTKTMIAVTSAEITRTTRQIEEMQSSYDMVCKTDVDTYQDLDTQIDTLNISSATLRRGLRSLLTIEDPNKVKDALLSVQPSLNSISSNLPPDPTSSVNRTAFVTTLEASKTLLAEQSKLDQAQYQLLARKTDLEHLRDHNQISCPECKHTWSAGYSVASYDAVVSKIASNATTLTSIEHQLEEHNASMESMREYQSQLTTYTNIVRDWTVLQPLWDLIEAGNYILTKPENITAMVEEVSGDLDIHIQLATINQRIVEYQEVLKMKSLVSEEDRTTLSNTLTAENNRLFELNSQVTTLNDRVKVLTTYVSLLTRAESEGVTLDANLRSRQTLGTQLIETYRQEAINDLIRSVKVSMSSKELILSKVDIQRALVDNISSQVSELEVEARLVKAAVKELSPTEGLIAKGLIGFINNFTTLMNSFIKKIWLYPLEILPITVDDSDVDLDFKFPVAVNDRYTAKDVALTSSAMKEVIELAFRIVSMRFLGLQQAPLFLDEFSVKMDHSHRQAAFFAITNLLTTADFSQIYMVSHYESSYGSLKNSDITVLSASNIILPKDLAFNKHVVMR